MNHLKSLDLGLIGNGTIGALIDPRANIVWGCFPRFDGDPLFCALLQERDEAGFFSVELDDFEKSEQHYLTNTAILVTRLFDRHGGVVEITDYAPRFGQYGRLFRPMMLVRRLTRLSGSPRLTVRLRPSCLNGAERPTITWGSHHVRYVAPSITLRLTTDASLTAIMQEMPFFLRDTVTLMLGPDETVPEGVAELGRRSLDETTAYWREWVRVLAIPFEWQEAVIRAAITLKLNSYDDTGAIIAAMTSSIPEASHSGRNWDYRYCWLRDGYFVVNALNHLGVTRTMERYLGYIVNIAANVGEGPLQPVYGIDGRTDLDESELTALAGYRGMGPVRVGNLAYRQVQHDVYGSAILAATHIFFDKRLARRGDEALFRRLEVLGEQARRCHDQPDAGLWELRGSARVHTFSAVMCWAACDRLAKAADKLGLDGRAVFWNERAAVIRARIEKEAYLPEEGRFGASFGGTELDASLLQLVDLGFLTPDDPRQVATFDAIERDLKKGPYLFRYVEPDDFGEPETAFNFCTFWFIEALHQNGRIEEAREIFEQMLSRRTHAGLLSEDISLADDELWGNYPQTYSLVGIINCAIILSRSWTDVR